MAKENPEAMATVPTPLRQIDSSSASSSHGTATGRTEVVSPSTNAGHGRRLENRHVQVISIGGSIGTAIFISIGIGLARGGPLFLVLSFCLYAVFLSCINSCLAEMSVQYPMPGGFVPMATHWVDSALGFAAGWNVVLYQALLIPFEISALSVLISFWWDAPPGVVPAVSISIYAGLNFFNVKAYGEAEFWLSSGKVLLIAIFVFYTIFTMCGANPEHDAYGFGYWLNPGPVAEYRSTGASGYFQGFLAAYFNATFVIVGPEYPAIVAGEAKHPRTYVKTAFKLVYWRFALFFLLIAGSVSVVIPYNDKTLQDITSGVMIDGTAAASPFVMSMMRLKIKFLPHIVNAMMASSILSAGNTYVFCGSRTLRSLAEKGQAPAFLKTKSSKGVPIYSVAVVWSISFLAMLECNAGSLRVLKILTNLVNGGALVNYTIVGIIYLKFYRATQAQGIDRKKLPYYGWGQPYIGRIGLVAMGLTLCCYGYTSLSPWDAQSFFSYYGMPIICAVLCLGWKHVKHTSIVKASEADLILNTLDVERYEAEEATPKLGFCRDVSGHILRMSGFKSKASGESSVT